MTPTATAIERAIRVNIDFLLETLRGVPPDVFNTWRPAAAKSSHEMNTLAALATHTVSAAEFHSPHMVGRQPSDRDRASEFVATTTYEEIERRFTAYLDALHGMTEADFGVHPPAEPDEPDWTNADWLVHTLYHTALHTGHLQIQRQLWEYEAREG